MESTFRRVKAEEAPKITVGWAALMEGVHGPERAKLNWRPTRENRKFAASGGQHGLRIGPQGVEPGRGVNIDPREWYRFALQTRLPHYVLGRPSQAVGQHDPRQEKQCDINRLVQGYPRAQRCQALGYTVEKGRRGDSSNQILGRRRKKRSGQKAGQDGKRGWLFGCLGTKAPNVCGVSAWVFGELGGFETSAGGSDHQALQCKPAEATPWRDAWETVSAILLQRANFFGQLPCNRGSAVLPVLLDEMNRTLSMDTLGDGEESMTETSPPGDQAFSVTLCQSLLGFLSPKVNRQDQTQTTEDKLPGIIRCAIDAAPFKANGKTARRSGRTQTNLTLQPESAQRAQCSDW